MGRELPLGIKILFNISGPLGVGLALLGYLNAGLGLAFLFGTVLYVGWELYPPVVEFTKRRPMLSLPAFLCAGLVMGFCAWLLVMRIKAAPDPVKAPVAHIAVPPSGERAIFPLPAGFTMKPHDVTANVIIKDSPLITPDRKLVIQKDITRFRGYLLDLGIPVPEELPAFKVVPGISGGMQTPPDLPAYRSTISIGTARTQSTSGYCDYVFTLRFEKVMDTITDVLRLTIIQKSLVEYFNFSFWDESPAKDQPDLLLHPLWEIRGQLGKEFTDTLLAFTMKSIWDNPNEGAQGIGIDPLLYFGRKLKIGSSIVGDSHWMQIEEILKKNEWPVDKF